MRLRNQDAQEHCEDSPQLVLVPNVEANEPSATTLTEIPSTTNRPTSLFSAESATCEKTVASPKSPLILPPGIKTYYQERDIAIICGDCREVLPQIEFGIIVSDPPYGISHPTNYAERGRSNLAACSDYPKVFGDDVPFDPSPFVKWPCVLFGANYSAETCQTVAGLSGTSSDLTTLTNQPPR